jgi:excisionase family DNA binding protein
MTVNEAAAYLKVERTTLYLYCRRGLLPFYELRSGRGRRFKQEDLDALLTPSQPVQNDEPA